MNKFRLQLRLPRSLIALSVALFALLWGVADAAADDADHLKQTLAKLLPSLTIDSVRQTPVPGLYEVVAGSHVVYMDKNAEYMLDGDMVNLRTRENFTEKAKMRIRLNLLDALGEDKMLVYKPQKVEHKITVVTDVNCPYCRRLHSEMGEYMENNVEVRYIFMPLKGQDDVSKTESVWCADDPYKALDIAKNGGTVKPKTCDNPLDEHMETARKLGVRGTPAIILENGDMLPGYVPADKLVAELNRMASESH